MKLDGKYKAFCFDMDDTLLRTHVNYAKMGEVIVKDMIESGIPKEYINMEESYRLNLESGVNYLMSQGRGHEIDKIGKRIESSLRDVEMETADQAMPFAKTVELLEKCRSKGLKIGVLTRGCREYAMKVCKICGVDRYVDGLVARDDFPPTEAKPNPIAMVHIADILGIKTTDILYFGDQLTDYKCAVNAGSGFVAVSTGPFPESDWKKTDAENIYPSLNEFVEDLEF